MFVGTFDADPRGSHTSIGIGHQTCTVAAAAGAPASTCVLGSGAAPGRRPHLLRLLLLLLLLCFLLLLLILLLFCLLLRALLLRLRLPLPLERHAHLAAASHPHHSAAMARPLSLNSMTCPEPMLPWAIWIVLATHASAAIADPPCHGSQPILTRNRTELQH